MLELADIVRVAGPHFRATHRLLPSQARALDDIIRCRTPALGGALYQCDACGARDFAYHSCRNRHCPKCQDDRAQRWLTRVRARMLPCPHYLLTFTLPAQLRCLARAHQRVVYSALVREAAAAVQTLAGNPDWVGGQVGVLAVLHTWTRTLEYHPHVHLVVTAGGLAADGSTWMQPAHERFLMPGFVLSTLFRRRLQRALTRAGLAGDIPPAVWRRRWTVHVAPIGTGDHALRYLARYVFHVALSNARLIRFANGRVTYSYVHARTGETRQLRVPVDEFMTRFLQHVLPRRFTKVRYFGLLSSGCGARREHARAILEHHAEASQSPTARPREWSTADVDMIRAPAFGQKALEPVRQCPACHGGRLRLIEHIHARSPP